ncbi:MATH domain and coiled-coil domain-containing protein [Trifolium repens]|nr:MATH domain and coiled-coil domain-containing protein [Trifolium repens]
MEHQEMKVEIFEKFTWKIENFSHLNAKELYSDPIVLGGYPWRILLFPKGNDVDNSLSIYFEAMQTANMSKGWSRDVKFKLLVFNQLDKNIAVIRETNHELNASQNNWGFHSFMSLAELHDPNKGFIVNDACIVGAEVLVCNVKHENQVNQEAKLIVSPTSIEKIMDFSSVGQLEEIYSHNNPSLIESQPKRSREFTDSAFAALGRVIHFLKTRKVKDMNDQACKQLQVLWDELEKFRFDLTWLEPHVQYALGMKNYVERALVVKRLKENVVELVLETERLKAKLVAAETNLDIERCLLKGKGFKEMDLDSELGCGNWRK